MAHSCILDWRRPGLVFLGFGCCGFLEKGGSLFLGPLGLWAHENCNFRVWGFVLCSLVLGALVWCLGDGVPAHGRRAASIFQFSSCNLKMYFNI